MTAAPIEAFCSMCGALVPHALEGRAWSPIEHVAPECDRPCLGGGIDRDRFLLGVNHAMWCQVCDADGFFDVLICEDE